MEHEERIIQIGDRNIGHNIKKLREEQELKQTDVIAKLQLQGIKISVYSFSKIENGKQNPTVSLLSALTQILNCDFNRLFREKNQ